MSAPRMSARQQYVVEYVKAHSGATIAQVARYEWGGRGHAASYARVARLLRRGILVGRRDGAAVRLTVGPTVMP